MKLATDSAYGLVQVHPNNRLITTCHTVEEGIYVDVVLPVGLPSVSKAFRAIADRLPWIARQRGVEIVDYILIGGPHGYTVNEASISLS